MHERTPFCKRRLAVPESDGGKKERMGGGEISVHLFEAKMPTEGSEGGAL
jgi:hypothetical protein